MKGSMLLMDFNSEDELNAWLALEPYVTQDVWRAIEVHKCNVREPWQFNRPKEFFQVASVPKITAQVASTSTSVSRVSPRRSNSVSKSKWLCRFSQI